MKKILLSIFLVFIMMFGTTFAYNLNVKDTNFINKITNKLDLIYKKSPDKIHKIHKKIYDLLNGKLEGKENTRVYIIINQLKRHIYTLFDEDDEENENHVLDINSILNDNDTPSIILERTKNQTVILDRLKNFNTYLKNRCYYSDDMKEIKIGDKFNIENIEYEILNVEIIDYFVGGKYFWKPKKKEFISVSFMVKRINYIEDYNVNKEKTLVANYCINGYTSDNEEITISIDSNTSQNNIGSGKDVFINGKKVYSNYLYNFGHGRNFYYKKAGIFDIENLDYSQSYLNFGNKFKLSLGFLNK